MIKRNTGTKVGVAAVLALALAACGDAVAPEVTNVEFAASLGIDLALMTETASGLFIREDSIGVGEPAAAGDQVTVAYTGWLADGEIFDSSASFVITALPVLGGPGLIAGFTECVTGMRVDGIKTCVLPADLGYGSEGQGNIPSDAVLIFEITVLSIVRPQG